MERLNGEIRDREKVVRGLKKAESPLLSGYQIYHNYVRPHMSLNGETPADRAGIKIQGQDKWRTDRERKPMIEFSFEIFLVFVFGFLSGAIFDTFIDFSRKIKNRQKSCKRD